MGRNKFWFPCYSCKLIHITQYLKKWITSPLLMKQHCSTVCESYQHKHSNSYSLFHTSRSVISNSECRRYKLLFRNNNKSNTLKYKHSTALHRGLKVFNKNKINYKYEPNIPHLLYKILTRKLLYTQCSRENIVKCIRLNHLKRWKLNLKWAWEKSGIDEIKNLTCSVWSFWSVIWNIYYIDIMLLFCYNNSEAVWHFRVDIADTA